MNHLARLVSNYFPSKLYCVELVTRSLGTRIEGYDHELFFFQNYEKA